MTVLLKILQVILALSILIIIHEAGHFTWARIFRIRVDKFFLFFDFGGVRLFSTRMPWFVKLFPAAEKCETEYGIGWLPLGGYCKIAGMVDESMDTDFLQQEPQPWEFRSRPPWQRLFVMSGGVINNFLLALGLFVAILAIWGDTYLPADYPIYVDDLGEEVGFRSGDRILLYDGKAPEDFLSLQPDLVRKRVSTVTLLRGTDTLTLWIDQNMIGDILNSPGMIDIAIPFIVDSVMVNSPNAGAGIRPGDHVFRVEGCETPYLQDARKQFSAHAGEAVSLDVVRGADTLTLPVQIDSAGYLGVFTRNPVVEHRSYSVVEAIPAGCRLAWSQVKGYLMDLRLVATPSTGAYKSVGSFVAIGQVFPSSWNWYQFLYILAMLSIMLGVMNLLPIPALDGGFIVFCLFEIITGRKPSDRFLMGAQVVGMVLLFLLMFLAFGNDIARLIP